jgi:glycosyltransferase involved in cell wall biosynthesis
MSPSSLAIARAGAAGRERLERFAIVYFGNDWSAENRTSSHHVAERLARRTSLLYVDSPGLRGPKANARDLRKLWRKASAALRRPRRVGERMWQMSVPQIPFRRIPLVRRANAWLGRLLVRRALAHLGFARTVSWFAVPHPGCLAGAVGETAVIYYCIDDYAALPGVDAREVAAMDAHLTRRADQVFVASARMLDAKRRERPSTVLAPHGVDVALFRTASDPRLPVAAGARRLGRPVVGFYGSIEEWIDLDLVTEAAVRRPDWTFLLVGRVAVDASRSAALPNVVFAGAQPYADLPAWVRAFDVAIIPYRLTRQVLNSAPLKLREYLATGKPVVAVPAPEIERFAPLVRLAQGAEEFIRQIEDALQNDTERDRARRMAATASMTWEARVASVVEVVERRLWQKAHQRI